MGDEGNFLWSDRALTIIKFLERKCQALELIRTIHHPINQNSRGFIKPTQLEYVTTYSSCVMCRGTHPLHKLKQF
jgi:hypothetical protein